MPNVFIITGSQVERLKNVIRDSRTSATIIRSAITSLTHILSQEMHKPDVVERNFTTPMGIQTSGEILSFPVRVVVTTRDDRDSMGEALSIAFGSCALGCMDFEGRRALEALNQPVRHASLPIVDRSIDTLIVGKVVLATGCTAITLTKTAQANYSPNRVFICSLFYSEQGISDLRSDFPDADIFLTGNPDKIQPDGMLVPGVGIIDKRIRTDE